jgi:hypothetical protein
MLASSRGKKDRSTVRSTLDWIPKPNHTRNRGATAIFGTSWMKTRSGYATRRATSDSAITSPSGMLRATVMANPMMISRSVITVFCHRACRAW